MINGLPADLVDFDRLRPFLENFAARSHGRWSVGNLETDIVARDKQVWVAGIWQAVVLTEVGPDRVTILAGAGSDRHEWEDEMDETITAWARSLGKRYVFALTRPGWAKAAKSLGYREIHREFVKEVM